MIVAFDPGRNLGVAFVTDDGKLLRRQIVALGDLAALDLPEGATVVVGDGTGSGAVVDALRRRGLTPAVVGERGTTLDARELYFAANPPKGLARLVPKGLRSPPGPVDDYAAYAVALRWLAAEGKAPPG